MAMRLKKRIEGAKKALRRNSGAGMLVVVITSLVVLLLGSALLYASYNVYVLRLTQMKSESNFTSADAGMEEIRAGLQGVSSDAIGAGYDNVIANYTSGATEETFRDGYFKCLFNWEDENNVKLFTGSSPKSISSYNVEVLKGFLDPVPGTAEYTLTAGRDGGTTGTVEQSTDNGTLTLKDLRLTYIKNGYETTISTDLYLAVPPVPIYSAINTSDVADYVIIADRGVEVLRKQSLTIDGDMYAGSVDIGDGATVNVNANHTLVVGQTYDLDSSRNIQMNADRTEKKMSGDVIVDGSVKYDNQGKLNNDPVNAAMNLGNNARLWAHEIDVNGGKINMAGGDNAAVYVADDLNIGRYADVTLKGTYFGFGNGTTIEENAGLMSASQMSSAILFRTKGLSGHESSLDMSGLSSLTLAGTAFVLPTNAGSEVPMGSSIATRAEQLAYLVPENLLGGKTNPEIMTMEDADATAAETTALKQAALANKSKPLWSGSHNSLATYGIDGEDDIAVLSYPISSSQRAFYTFMKFPTRDQANTYFTDFFTKNSATVSSYISQYASLKTLPSGAAASLAGTGLSKDGDTYKVTTSTGDNADTNSTRYQKIYQTLSRTMTTNNTTKTTPFNYYINTDVLDDLFDDGGKFERSQIADSNDKSKIAITAVESNNNGKAECRKITYFRDQNNQSDRGFIVAKGNYLASGNGDYNKVIICDGDVTVRSYDMKQGMIICSGKLYVDMAYTIDKYDGTNPQYINGAQIPSVMDMLGTYSEGLWKGGTKSQTENTDTWSVDEIVGFRNWKKNAE